MEMHLVHGIKATETKPAIPQVVVAVLFDDAASATAALDPIVNTLPINECDHKDGTELDLDKILPDDLRHYYSYNGSLTAPDCRQGLKWIILKAHARASADQREKIKGTIGSNARQARNPIGRAVRLFVVPTKKN